MIASHVVERMIGCERALWGDLVEVDDGTPAVFEDLLRRSAPHLRGHLVPRWDARSAFTPSSDGPKASSDGLPPTILAEWDAYALRWAAFVGRNPLMGVADVLSEISEGHDGSSWPYGLEDAIHAWAVSGFEGERPFRDGWKLDRPEWRERLAALAETVGSRWVRYDEVGTRLEVYVPPAPAAGPSAS